MPSSEPSHRQISIQTKPTGQTGSNVTIQLATAPETPQPGSAGKQVGEITLIEKASETYQVVVSLGEPDKIKTETWRQAGGSIARWLKRSGVVRADLPFSAFETEGDRFDAFTAFIEGLFLGAFEFTRYKKSNGNDPQEDVFIYVTGASGGYDLDSAIGKIAAITKTVNLARDWAHEPANIINPVSLAERVLNFSNERLKVTVLDDQQLDQMSAGGIFSVGKGSQTGPRMIIIEYPGIDPDAGAKPVVLVGKAITFDTGGYSMKDVTGIQGMKYDKCGGVNVAAILKAAAELKIKLPIVGIICAAENMVSAQAYRPDDIIRTLSGKTVEIITTDAEGRLVLADGLTYAQKNYQPRAIIDMATLTGGIVTALGRVRAGMFSNNQELADQLKQAGDEVSERLWQMPLDDDYFPNIKGDEADLKNSGGREGHPIMGGIFLKQFIENDIPWAHLDIAGVSEANKDLPYCPKGATGFGVRLFLKYLENLAAE
jgi:leucyl aminopeptidase